MGPDLHILPGQLDVLYVLREVLRGCYFHLFLSVAGYFTARLVEFFKTARTIHANLQQNTSFVHGSHTL